MILRLGFTKDYKKTPLIKLNTVNKMTEVNIIAFEPDLRINIQS